MNLTISVVDFGVGNTCSVVNALLSLGYAAIVSSNELQIRRSDVLILPGVGAFEVAMKNLKEKGLDKVLTDEVLGRGKPVLGICLGMQMLATYSEENGVHQGLNWIPGAIKKLSPEDLSVPHVGWNNVHVLQDRPLFSRNVSGAHFYFDHSYHFECAPGYVSAYVDYGVRVTAAVQRDNIYGVQFHPEKSQTNGLKLLRSFVSSFEEDCHSC